MANKAVLNPFKSLLKAIGRQSEVEGLPIFQRLSNLNLVFNQKKMIIFIPGHVQPISATILFCRTSIGFL